MPLLVAVMAETGGTAYGRGRTFTSSLSASGIARRDATCTTLAPAYPKFDLLTQAKQLLQIAETVPKGLKWKTRARVGDRVRWYELPEEVDH